MKKLFKLIIVSTFIILSGCKEDTKSVEYYMSHKAERIEKIKECKTEADTSENCNNASAAQFKAGNSIPRF